MDESRDSDPVMKAVVAHWMTKIDHARNHKRKVFQEFADECMGFYNGPREWGRVMGGATGLEARELIPDPTFHMKVNKAFEMVGLYGPALYYANPVRTATPVQPLDVPPEFYPDPYVYQSLAIQSQQRLQLHAQIAAEMQEYLNWTPVENRLAAAARQAIEEALIKGRGCVWTELVKPPGSGLRSAASLYDSVDNLLVDPDGDEVGHAGWIARRCTHPTWQVERDYGLAPGSLRGNLESQATQAEVALDGSGDALYDRKRGLTSDLITYWKVWSKLGIGGRLSGINKRFRGPLEMFGDYVFLAIARDVPYPLNLPPSAQRQAGFEGGGDGGAVLARLAWPTPYWRLPGGWPVSVLDFHPIANSPWPLAHLRAGMGELKFLNWAMSFLTGKMRTTCRDFIAVKKEAAEEIKTSLLGGGDLTLLEIEAQYGTISEVVQFLQHPAVNSDIWKVIEAVEHNFDKRVGLNELMYGGTGPTQPRSATEIQSRSSSMNVRPDDMARQVEAWMAEVSFKEAIAARFHLTSADVAPQLGELAGWFWDRFIHTADLDVLTRQIDYRIEAGSARKPNRDTQVQQSQESLQALLPVFQQYMTLTGDVGPINNLLADWAKARDLDPAKYRLAALPPPPPPVAAPEAAPPT